MERKAISIMKACALVGVSRRTIYNWITAGKVEYVRTAGGSVRIFVDSLWRNPHAQEPAFDGTFADALRGEQVSADPAELRQLFHTLNNQLGIILSHAELIEAKAQDERQKARASQVVIATVEALTTAREIRAAVEGVAAGQ